MELVKLIEYILEGLLGTAALLVLPVAVILTAEILERRAKKQRSTTEVILENHLLDKLNERIKK